MTIMTSAKIDMPILYFDMVIKNGKTVMRLAKLAPAPSKTKIAGKAQHIKVDEEVNKEKISNDLLFFSYNLLVC